MRRRLRARVTSAVRRSGAKKAIVIDVAPGKATVKLSITGAKLHMLPVSGDVSVGDNVIVDYSGPVPLVKATF